MALADLQAAEGQNAQFEVGGETVRAFMVQEDSDADRPGVVVVHGWWGLNEQIRGVTERVTELGYVAIVPDLYRGRLPADHGYAHDFMRDLDEKWAMQVLKGAIQYLRSMPGAARRPVGMIGFDMGGQLTLTAALQGLPVQTAISFYGDTRNNRDELELLDVPFLGIYARDDRATPPDEVKQFESLLEELGKTSKIVVMPDVGRYFSNEDRPGFDAEATASAWFLTNSFLADNLAGSEYEPRHRGNAFNDERVQKDSRWKKKQPPPD
jgi:carboxymethylenebutenolidase